MIARMVEGGTSAGLGDLRQLADLCGRALTCLTRFPFAVSCFAAAVIVSGPHAVRPLIELPASFGVLAAFVALIPPAAWYVDHRPATTRLWLLGQDAPTNNPAPITGIVVLVLSLMFGLGFAGGEPRDPQRAAEAAQQPRETEQATTSSTVLAQLLLELAARVEQLEGLRTDKPDDRPPTLDVPELRCGGDDASKLDLHFAQRPDPDKSYWAVRENQHATGRFPHGPPGTPDDSTLRFYVPIPLCGVDYTISVFKCGDAGDKEIGDVVSQGRDSTLDRIPDDCTRIAKTTLGVRK
jgi:hypothetical protein